ncbi:MAG: ABC transporter permease [Firmicutes bacterium]|nr:ABC transporter permease [Bacillota bacterium]
MSERPSQVIRVLAAMTLREMVRKRLFTVGALLTLGFLAVYGLGLHYAREDLLGGAAGTAADPRWNTARLVVGSQLMAVGLYLGGMLAAFVAALAGAGALQGEVESGILQVVAARPVRRAAILAGKFAAHALVLGAYAFLVFAAVTLLTHWVMGVPLPSFLAAGATFALIPITVSAAAFFVSARLSTLPAGALLVILIGSAMVGGMLEQIGAVAGSDALRSVGLYTSLAMPSDSLYRRVAALLLGDTAGQGPLGLLTQVGPLGAAAVPSMWVVAYALVYVCALGLVTALHMERRDL